MYDKVAKLQNTQKSILFIGNSFTYYNNMPQIVKEIATYNGENIVVDQIAFSGYRLCEYLDKRWKSGKILLQKLQERRWDFIVLQEQSAMPFREKEKFFEAVKKLNVKIKENGAQTVLFQTWSYRKTSSKLGLLNISYDEFYKALKSAYTEIANDIQCILVPVGDVFYDLNVKYPEIELLCDDDYHPNLNGSYVASCMFYSFLVKNSKKINYISPGIDYSISSVLYEYIIKHSWIL